ncbi:hypothetical protein Poli38472_009426 [Pythium oligandrum]|uniref:Uncharacterized protein n=1 Tax=Pythium oligandrum TaxID=41045 RepID=A0A8K1CKL5_PYTOL|nr:hypothetical protein Poli38472_009426 [Pythium oligandrum]|eukprot:TMW65259.1 hypothetical protein Poli38472_009426 [Pythium oligandrum]
MTTEAKLPRRWSALRFHGFRSAPEITPSTAVLKQGLLIKKGHRLPSQKERFFVLQPQLLRYFRSSSQTSLKGAITLSPTDLVTPIATSRHWFLLQKLSGPDGKSYKLELRERQELMVHQEASTRSVRDNERERELTRMRTVLNLRDPLVASTVLRQNATKLDSARSRAASMAELRATFQVFHELVLLQSLVSTIKSSWGTPSSWTCEQYDQLVESITLAQAKAPASSNEESLLGTACALRYAYEEIPENQLRLLKRKESQEDTVRSTLDTPIRLGTQESVPGRLRCPTIYSYLSTFERLSLDPERSTSTVSRDGSGSVQSLPAGSARSSLANGELLSPRSSTLAKYAHLYLEEEGRQQHHWGWERVEGDLLTEIAPSEGISSFLIKRFEESRVYSYVHHHTMLFMNPHRMLKTSKFTSIYDEQVVLVYEETPFALTQLAPHPFAMAKQSIFRLFFSPKSGTQNVILFGESGSGKTEMAKELLKYVVTTAKPSNGITHPKVVFYTSSTKSTLQMRSDESRTLALLQAKGVSSYEVVLLDLYPERWTEMVSVSKSKRLPQIHIDGIFFGFYETLQRLEDEEQLRMYFQNPLAAKKLSLVLDSNILLEAFGHASTPINLNSSRYGRVLDLEIAFGRDPAEFQVEGCRLTPCLLEKSRVTSTKNGPEELNFHIFYALVAAANETPHLLSKRETFHLNGTAPESFRYLTHQKPIAAGSRAKKDVERFQSILHTMESIGLAHEERDAIFTVLSAILWLGNLKFELDATTELWVIRGATTTGDSIATVVQQLLALDDLEALRALLLSRRVELAATGEVFDVDRSLNEVRHARDTLSRLLYQVVFTFVVTKMNETTQASRDGRNDIRVLRIIDMFGFENFERNSLEQLCINYSTEKLASFEMGILSAAHGVSVFSPDFSTLQLIEHPLGVFATLEEQTVLHRGETKTTEQDQHKNGVFLRYLNQRNPSLPSPPPRRSELKVLSFVLPHTRDSVVYDASDFVEKNSDFQYASFLDGIAKSTNQIIKRMVQSYSESQPISSKPSTSLITGGGSLVTQFRLHMQRVETLITDKDAPLPLYIHCLRPNSNGWNAEVDREMVEKQVKAHRIHSMASTSSEDYFELKLGRAMCQQRYRCLLASDDSGDEALRDGILSLLARDEASSGFLMVNVDSDSVWLKTIELGEKLEIFLIMRRGEAATSIQSTARMWIVRRWYRQIQHERRVLERDLLEIYGPNSSRKIAKTLLKYDGREDELRLKIAEKKRELACIAEVSSGMEHFIALSGGALDAALFDVVLRDPVIQRMLQSDERIIVALREMSLDPQILGKQLADAALREFYQILLSLLEQKVLAEKEEQETASTLSQLTLEELIRDLVASHHGAWAAAASKEPWVSVKDRLEEIGEEPEMLLFYLDDEGFVSQVTEFVHQLREQVKGSTVVPNVSTNPDLIKHLMRIQFDARLMAAMQGDPYFVASLENPQLVGAIHQFMTNRQGFAAHGELNVPVVNEFFHRLVQLSDLCSE